MKDYEETLRRLRTDLDNERRVRVCIQEAQELERSRITAVEDTANIQTNFFADIRSALNTLNANIRSNKAQRKAADDKLGAAILANEQGGHAVLEAHTASIFRLEARLDQLAEQFAAAGFQPIHQSHGKHLADDDRPDVEGEVDRTERIINSAGTHARDPVSPLRT